MYVNHYTYFNVYQWHPIWRRLVLKDILQLMIFKNFVRITKTSLKNFLKIRVSWNSAWACSKLFLISGKNPDLSVITISYVKKSIQLCICLILLKSNYTVFLYKITVFFGLPGLFLILTIFNYASFKKLLVEVIVKKEIGLDR